MVSPSTSTEIGLSAVTPDDASTSKHQSGCLGVWRISACCMEGCLKDFIISRHEVGRLQPGQDVIIRKSFARFELLDSWLRRSRKSSPGYRMK